MNYTFYKSKKYRCPSCGHDNRYRRFIDDNNHLLPEQYGICDRMNSCGYANFPRKEDSIPTFEKVKVVTIPKEISYIPEEDMLITQERLDFNVLFTYLSSLFDYNTVKKVFQDYYVGTVDFYGQSPCFWKIDLDGRVRTGKVMRYSDKGKRVKEDYSFKWMHRRGSHFVQVPFGAHLIEKGDIVNVVESEKTALICSIFYPEQKWVAVGGSNCLKQLEYLKNYASYFILHPDSGMYYYWRSKALKYKLNFLIKSYDHLPKGDDIADIIIKYADTKIKTFSRF